MAVYDMQGMYDEVKQIVEKANIFANCRWKCKMLSGDTCIIIGLDDNDIYKIYPANSVFNFYLSCNNQGSALPTPSYHLLSFLDKVVV